MVVGFNLSATLNVARLFKDPKLCIPSIKYANFNEIQLPLPSHIKAIVLDKDNCFAKPHDDKVWPEYQEQWDKLKQLYPGKKLLIVSNSAGTNDDIGHIQAKTLEKSTGVPVLLHSIKKPGCHVEIMAYFKKSKVCEDQKAKKMIQKHLVASFNGSNRSSVFHHSGLLLFYASIFMI